MEELRKTMRKAFGRPEGQPWSVEEEREIFNAAKLLQIGQCDKFLRYMLEAKDSEKRKWWKPVKVVNALRDWSGTIDKANAYAEWKKQKEARL